MREFILSRARLCFRTEIWSDVQSKEAVRSFWAAFFGAHQQGTCSIGGDVAQERVSPSPSCGVRLSLRCVPVCARSREQGRLPCTCSWLGISSKVLATPVANKFYGAMAWPGYHAFFQFKAENTQSETHMHLLWYPWGALLLPNARDIGTRKKLISQNSQLSPQSAFEEVWIIVVILCAVHLWHLSKLKLSSVVLTLKSTALYHSRGSELGEFLKPGLWKDSKNSLLW